MDEREHERLRSLIAPYVLGAVPAEEIPEVRSHLLTCEECMAAADDYAAVGDDVALSAGAAAVPAGFSERILAQVADERPVVAADPRRARRWSLLPVLSVAALLLITAVFAVSLYRADRRADVARQALAGLLPGEGMELGGEGGRAAMVESGDGVLFVADGLSELPSDKVYEIWLMKGECDPAAFGDCTIEGVETFSSEGGLVIVELGGSLDGYSRAAVTVEPAGGSPQPTSDPIVDSAV